MLNSKRINDESSLKLLYPEISNEAEKTARSRKNPSAGNENGYVLDISNRNNGTDKAVYPDDTIIGRNINGKLNELGSLLSDDSYNLLKNIIKDLKDQNPSLVDKLLDYIIQKAKNNPDNVEETMMNLGDILDNISSVSPQVTDKFLKLLNRIPDELKDDYIGTFKNLLSEPGNLESPKILIDKGTGTYKINNSGIKQNNSVELYLEVTSTLSVTAENGSFKLFISATKSVSATLSGKFLEPYFNNIKGLTGDSGQLNEFIDAISDILHKFSEGDFAGLFKLNSLSSEWDSEIGRVLQEKGDADGALKYFRKAVQKENKTSSYSPQNVLDIAKNFFTSIENNPEAG